jgi:hypothetical protein
MVTMARPTKYARSQRRRQSRWKQSTDQLPEGAKQPGAWKNIPCEFILPVEYAEHNIWSPIREEVIEYFRAHRVSWHDEDKDVYGPRETKAPSPHLLDSQICAINFWWGLAKNPGVLTALSVTGLRG